jgi:hypothetical protein
VPYKELEEEEVVVDGWPLVEVTVAVASVVIVPVTVIAGCPPRITVEGGELSDVANPASPTP